MHSAIFYRGQETCGVRFSLSFAGRSGFNVKHVLHEIPDILPGRCEPKILTGEVADTEVSGDHGTSRSESDDESVHDSIASLGLRDAFLSGIEMTGRSVTFQVRQATPDGHDKRDHESVHRRSAQCKDNPEWA